MDRRKFVVGSLVTGGAMIPVVGASASSRYGTPGSHGIEIAEVNLSRNKLKLSLAHAGIPVQVWEEISGFILATNALYSSDESRQFFRRDPAAFLSRYGVKPEHIPSGSGELRTLLAVVNDDVRVAAASGNLTLLLDTLRAGNYIGQPLDASVISKQLSETLKKDSDRLASSLDVLRSKLDSLGEVDFCDEELVFIANELEKNAVAPLCSVAAAACLVWIAVAVHEYVAVSIALIAAIAVAVKISVFGQEQSANGVLHGQFLGAFDPQGQMDFSVAAKVASLTGNKKLCEEVKNSVIGKEVDVVVSAMEQSGLIVLSMGTRYAVAEALKSLTYRVLARAGQ